MTKKVNSGGPKRSSTRLERPVVYRGIKILPIYGRPSATAKAFRDALLTKPGRQPAETTGAGSGPVGPVKKVKRARH